MSALGKSLGSARVVRETERAILVLIDDEEEAWIPKSVIHDDSEVWSEKSGDGELIVDEWWADQHGF